ncbi:MAG: YjjG family noncanonical pyrimidine nucleotidase [Cyclobacteriaceae bacterium]
MAYRDIFFDLDHTLWDYDTSARQTLDELYDRYHLSATGAADKKQLAEAFFAVNDGLWKKYNNGHISKYVLRTQRFQMIFEEIGVHPKLFGDEQVAGFNHDYLHECPQKPNLIPGAMELLESLHGKFRLHIITNGFDDIQQTKMDTSGLTKFFHHVITSESAKAKKPFPGIFDYALKKTDATIPGSIMVGDNLQTDIKGAREYGMKQVFFNPHRAEHNDEVSYEINELHELREIVGQ